MKSFKIQIADATNAGDAREWGLCAHYGVERSAHDSKRYDVASDIEVGDKHISVKASAFTLMSGSLCEGKETLDEIWGIFAERVHSNTFAYVTKDGTAYEMNLSEFKDLVYTFCKVERESEENGGAYKVRAKKESGIMRKWLEARA